mgnify:CR=1 FL=1
MKQALIQLLISNFHLMNIVAVVFLIAIFLIQVIAEKTHSDLRRNGFFGRVIFLAAAVSLFGYAAYLSWQQYRIWINNDLTKLFLPPYASLDYFIFYVRTRFFNAYLLSLLIGLGFLWGAKKINQKYEERFFEPIEPYLLETSIFIVGHPLWLFYMIILLTLYLFINSLFTIHNSLFKKGETPRISLYYLWLPAAIFTILISRWIEALSWWQVFKF